ncbi:hypothetical protein G7Y79_00057g090600 [Physcia stellaris]|nr:hypothetical protein G7Y79_00057g090600 [Physcia stellaris]
MSYQHSKEGRPPYGRRLLPCVLDDEAALNPERVFAIVPRSDDLSQGFNDVAFAQMANAVNYLAGRLQALFGPKPEHHFETLTYIGISDLRYNVVFYAAVKAGYKVFFPSPRNPTATNLLLMEETKSTKILYAKEMMGIVNQLCASNVDLLTANIESLKDLLEAQPSTFQYRPSFSQAVGHPVVVLHSSGSTGNPKPVVMKHGTFTSMDNDRNFPTVPGRKNHDATVFDFDGNRGRIFEPFPPFHVGGFFYKIVTPLYTNAVPVFGPPLRPPSGALVAEIMRQQRIRGCVLPPSVAEQLLHEPDGLDIIKGVDIFCYAGGPLSQAAGDAISAVTNLCQFYGSTEMGQVRQLLPRREDWSYMEFHPHAKLEFQPFDDGAYELVVFADASTADSSSLNHNYPGLEVWRTKDLFKPHPTKKDLWRFHGRVDDIIVLSSGEKLNPIPMENHLQGLPSISGAQVIGQGRFQPALLLEAKTSSQATNEDLIDQMWPAIEVANEKMPSHGRVARSKVMFARVDKPFIRAGKGTIIRRLNEAAYREELDKLYDSRPQKHLSQSRELVATAFKLNSVKEHVRSIFPSSLQANKLHDLDNLYLCGLDSIKTVEALEALKSSLLSHRAASDLAWLSLETFYENPSIQQLSQVILAFLNDGHVPSKKDRVAKMAETLERFTQSLGSPTEKLPNPNTSSDLCVAITGTTGSLGSYVLSNYIQDPRITKIFCLNRSKTAQQQWEGKCSSTNGSPSSGINKLHFLTVDFAQTNLGLSPSDYAKVTAECDFIVHTAWKVDFNQDLSSFEDNIQSVRTFIDWSISSPRRPRILLVSSISSVGPWNPTYQDTGIPEAAVEDLNAALDFGYSESKQVAERLLDKAAHAAKVPVSILRVGQIGGPSTKTQTKWTERELVPSMLKTSKSLGLLPTNMPPVDWIPVDVVATIIAEISFSTVGDLSTPQYYNIVNPNPVPWPTYQEVMKTYCGPHVQAVPLSEWIQKLQTFDAADVDQLAAKPALKLLKSFSYLASRGPTVTFQTSRSVHASKTMAELEPGRKFMLDLPHPSSEKQFKYEKVPALNHHAS